MLKLTTRTLAQKLLFAIVLLSLGLALTGAAGAYVVFRDRSERQKINDSSLYARERTRTEQALFENMRQQHAGATKDLQARLEAYRLLDTDQITNRLLPVKADGTRRSAPELFDGSMDERDGDFIYGIGAYLSHGAQMNADERRLFLAAMRVVAEHGAAAHSTLDNFYFVTPDTRMVMFAPDRKDRLIYYRQDAPATLDVSHEEMSLITLPKNDPE